MNNTSKILVAAAAGAVAGAVLGILFAPAKGEETRKKLKEQGGNLANDLKGKFEKVKEKFEDFKEGCKQPVNGKEEAAV